MARHSLGDGGRFPECLCAARSLCLRDSGAVAPSAASGLAALHSLPRAHRLCGRRQGAVKARQPSQRLIHPLPLSRERDKPKAGGEGLRVRDSSPPPSGGPLLSRKAGEGCAAKRLPRVEGRRLACPRIRRKGIAALLRTRHTACTEECEEVAGFPLRGNDELILHRVAL